MSDEPEKHYIEYALFLRIMRQMLKVLTSVVAERAALEEALLEAGTLPRERYLAIREKKLRDAEPAIRSLDEVSEEKLLALLRDYEGSVQ